MAALSLDQLRQLAASVGFPDPSLAASVAMAESGGVVGAVGDQALGGSYGLWQIYSQAHPEYDTTSLSSDPTYNAQAAFAISGGGTNWTPWSTYNSGAYKKFLVYPPKANWPLVVGILAVGAGLIWAIETRRIDVRRMG